MPKCPQRQRLGQEPAVQRRFSPGVAGTGNHHPGVQTSHRQAKRQPRVMSSAAGGEESILPHSSAFSRCLWMGSLTPPSLQGPGRHLSRPAIRQPGVSCAVPLFRVCPSIPPCSWGGGLSLTRAGAQDRGLPVSQRACDSQRERSLDVSAWGGEGVFLLLGGAAQPPMALRTSTHSKELRVIPVRRKVLYLKNIYFI